MADKQGFTLRMLFTDGPVFLIIIGVLVILGAGFLPLRHALIARKAADMITVSGVDSCAVGSVTIVAWKSVTCSNVQITTRIDTQYTCRIFCEELRINTSLPALLLRRNVFHYSRKAAKKKGKQPLSVNYEPLYQLLRALSQKKGGRLTGVTVTVTSGKKEVLRGINGTVRLTTRPKHVETPLVKMLLPVATVGGDGLQQVRADITLSSSGNVTVTDLHGEYFDGRLYGKAVIDLPRRRIDSYTCGIDTMDFAYWYTVHAGAGGIRGRISVNAKGSNVPWDMPLSNAQVQASLKECSITGLPVQKALATSLFLPLLSTLTFTRITATVGLNGSDTITTKLKGTGEQLDFSSEGWVLYNGKLQQNFNGVFSRKMVASFPDMARNTLVPAGEGKRRLSCRLFGTYSDPRFELDVATLRRAVGTMFDGLRKDIIDSHNGK